MGRRGFHLHDDAYVWPPSGRRTPYMFYTDDYAVTHALVWRSYSVDRGDTVLACTGIALPFTEPAIQGPQAVSCIQCLAVVS